MGAAYFIPILVSKLATDAAKDALTNVASLNLAEQLERQPADAPQTLDELPDRKTFFSTMSSSVALKVGIEFASAKTSALQKVAIQEYAIYKDIQKSKDARVRWGVSLRWINTVDILDVSINLTNLPMISAAAQLGYAAVTSQFTCEGIQPPNIDELMPIPGQLNVESYAEMNEAFEKIKGAIGKSDTKISPRVLAVYSDVNEPQDASYKEALLVSLALKRISQGWSLTKALSRTQPFDSNLRQRVIRSVYSDFVGSNMAETPSDVARNRVTKILADMTIKGPGDSWWT